MERLGEVTNQINEKRWDEAPVSLYIVKRRLVQRQAKYTIHYVNADDTLRVKLRGIVAGKIEASDQVREYDYVTSDLDGEVLALETNETDLHGIIETLRDNEHIDQITELDQLIGTWFYIIRLDLPDTPALFAVRKVPGSWSTKKVSTLVSMIFRDNMLVDLDQQDIFRLDGIVDFYAYDGFIFVLNKKTFESALNFRVSMEHNRDEFVTELQTLDVFEDTDSLRTLVGNNVRRLRKLSQVKNAGYYRKPDYMQNLKRVSDKRDWGLQYDDGKLIVNDDNIDSVLKHLNNDVLMSEVNAEYFDVDVKRKR